jgi:hypothetical protein
MSFTYEDLSHSHDDAIDLLESRSETNIITALISIGLNEQDSSWAQTICLKYLQSEVQSEAAAAITALGHIARRFGDLDKKTVMPALESVERKYPALEGTVADTFNDIEMFT